MGIVPQLCRNRLVDVTNIFNTILLSVLAQVYEFHGKWKKLKKTKLQRCVGKFTETQLSRTQQRHIKNPVKGLRWSLLQK